MDRDLNLLGMGLSILILVGAVLLSSLGKSICYYFGWRFIKLRRVGQVVEIFGAVALVILFILSPPDPAPLPPPSPFDSVASSFYI
ncbi:MAG: hypothetical protein ACLP2P_15500 [Desulfobaccales bacterium]